MLRYSKKEYIFVREFMKQVYTLLFVVMLSIQCMAGSDEIKLISLYPVPLKSSVLNVNINFGGSGIASIEIRNLIGKKIQEKQVPFGADKVEFENLDTNPNGVYMALAKDANGKVLVISKFIINK